MPLFGQRIVLFLVLASGMASWRAALAAGNSQTGEGMKEVLAPTQDADLNKDGILTRSEEKAHRKLERKAALQREAKAAGRKSGPPPTHAGVSYGPHPMNTLDFWRAESPEPTPVCVFIHGGGFSGGDRSNHGGMMLDECLKAGISYASIDYRLSYVAPYPAQMLDGARAVQFIRNQAREWNIDPRRIVAAGNSAGSGIAQWLAFHDDLADPNSDDPVARQSTRLSGAIALCMQSTYDFRTIREIIPGNAYKNGFAFLFFNLPEDWNWDAARVDADLDARLKDASPIHHLSRDDCPVYIMHREDDRRDGNIHHPNFGEHLKKAMEELGIDCVRVMDSDFKSGAHEIKEGRLPFLKKVFGMQ